MFNMTQFNNYYRYVNMHNLLHATETHLNNIINNNNKISIFMMNVINFT